MKPMKAVRRCWVMIDANTSVCLRQGQPVRIRTSGEEHERELAERRVEQWVGQPVRIGDWYPLGGGSGRRSRHPEYEVWQAECGLTETQPGNLDWN